MGYGKGMEWRVSKGITATGGEAKGEKKGEGGGGHEENEGRGEEHNARSGV